MAARANSWDFVPSKAILAARMRCLYAWRAAIVGLCGLVVVVSETLAVGEYWRKYPVKLRLSQQV
jgi:hypothetical protein